MITTSVSAYSDEGARSAQLASGFCTFAAAVMTASAGIPWNEVTGYAYFAALLLAVVPFVFCTVTACLCCSWRQGSLTLLLLAAIYALPLLI
ncbi:MAG: hypothetical protein JJ863_12330 [Deltaproteobacteria bacterium]|nr:hypothetical protein [Deltaproteobacteria bacterium]